MEPKCPVCNHKNVNEINRDMVLHAMPVRGVGTKYGLQPNAVAKHRPHITRNLALAVERREMSAADRLLEDTEMLWRESQQALEDSKECVKTMAITEGRGKGAKTIYKEYKDVGAVLAAIKVAHENRRLFGDATGAIKPTGSGGQVGIYLSIAMPRMDNTPPSIEATVLNTDEVQEGDPESPTEDTPEPSPESSPISSRLSVGQDNPHGLSPPTLRAEATVKAPIKKEYTPIGRWVPGGRGRPPAGITPPPPKPQAKRDMSIYVKRNKDAKRSIKEKIWGKKDESKG